jgi:hypothetical protein
MMLLITPRLACCLTAVCKSGSPSRSEVDSVDIHVLRLSLIRWKSTEENEDEMRLDWLAFFHGGPASGCHMGRDVVRSESDNRVAVSISF